MGDCICNKANREYEDDMIIDLEWNYKRGSIREFVRADTLPSNPETKHVLTLDKGHKPISIYLTDILSGTARGTEFRSEAFLLGQTLSPSVSPSNITLESQKFDTSNSLNSASSYWRNCGDIMSYDGVNKRISNRYDIGLGILKAQIQCGADPKVLTTHGDRSCLMFAVLAEDIDFVKQLVGLGVDVNKTNRSGETALTLALGLEGKDISKYLRKNGAVEDMR